VVVDAGQGFGGGAVCEEEAVHHIQLPEPHRRGSLPAFSGFPAPAFRHGVGDRGPNQTAIDGGLRGCRLDTFAGQLESLRDTPRP
jgi:hypothetical protein